jgi:zinc D-Ala-D-Ala carboxypeptidase
MTLLPEYSPRFPRAGLLASQTAARKGIKNDIPAELEPNLRRLSWTLDYIEKSLQEKIDPKARLYVSSAYRCLVLNKAIGGASNSQHMSARAADLTCNVLTPIELCRFIVKILPNFERIIHEFGSWCHVSIENEPGVADLRLRETARKVPSKLIPGKVSTVYLQGFM